ncbi:MAG TPA: SCO family protein [Spirochaetia bacterium]|nr:SCO family protein [Spirochaetia bacterium]
MLPAVIAIGFFVALGPGAWAHSVPSGFTDIGVDQKLGGQAALDARFYDESGREVSLRQLVTAPTILALVYYECPNVCDLLLTGLAGTIGGLDAEPGIDYNVVSISIDPRETRRDALKAKKLSMETIQREFPAKSWTFLTGTPASIYEVARSVGFHYKANGDGYDHPVAITILSPSGKIVRYMFGADFLPADLKLSLMEARSGTIGPTIARLARICFRVDPKSHTLVFMTTRVVATVTLVLAAALVAYLLLAGRRRKRAAHRA